jgi:hypothetical protein
MPAQVSPIVEWIEKLIDEKIRLEAIHAKRDELIKRNVSKDLIHSSVEDSQRKIAHAKAELTKLLDPLKER